MKKNQICLFVSNFSALNSISVANEPTGISLEFLLHYNVVITLSSTMNSLIFKHLLSSASRNLWRRPRRTCILSELMLQYFESMIFIFRQPT